MEHYVVIEKLSEAIRGRKITAALFYTFNFDVTFFENYILPIFVPNASFTDNEIQNAIHWRKYAKDLPPITVYCDFHAKSNAAPSLGYTVRTIDIKTMKGVKPCFHPKNSFLLLEDNSMLMLTGSNNISINGWCTNVEGVSIIELKGNQLFPRAFKDEVKSFANSICAMSNQDKSESETKLDVFFQQRRYTENTSLQFYNSINSNISQLLEEISGHNNDIPFLRMEIISPYLSTSIEFIKTALSLSELTKTFMLTPYCATNKAEISKEKYLEFESAGLIWSRMTEVDDDKMFRFNHSKIYRIKGEQEMFTIVGSANFTEAGWKGIQNNGNIESALVYIEPVTEWFDQLVEYHNPNIEFSISGGEGEIDNQRFDVPNLQFTIDWFTKTLIYNNIKSTNFRGKILFPTKNFEMSIGKNIQIQLNKDVLDHLAENAVIKVYEYGTQKEFLFFPQQLNLENKPYSLKLRLNDRQLIELWQKVSYKGNASNEISELLNTFITSHLNSEGEYSDKPQLSKSTMNTIASHINALIKLEAKLFEKPTKVGDFESAKEQLDYYLFTNNLDTLTGYRNLLNQMIKEQAMLPSVGWFIENLLFDKFYNYSKILKFYHDVKHTGEGLKAKVDGFKYDIQEEMKTLKKTISSSDVNDKLYKWVQNQISS